MWSTQPPRYPSFKAPRTLSFSSNSSNLWRQATQLRVVEVGMSLQVFVAHTGHRLEADTTVLSSLDSLRSWIAKSTGIPPQDQILLTVRGKHVKVQALLTEKEIFVYDRELFTLSSQQSASSLVPPVPIPEPFLPEEAPSTLANQTDFKAWQALFKARRDWANGLRDANRSMYGTAQKYAGDKDIIEKALRIATGNHETHIPRTEKKFREARAWFDDVSREQEANLRNLDRDINQLASIPARADFLRFVAKASSGAFGKGDGRSPSRGELTLRDFLDQEEIRQASSTGKKVSEKFGKRIAEMAATIERITSEYQGLVGTLSQSQSRSSVEDEEHMSGSRMMSEIEAVTKKIASDYEHILGLPPSQKSIPQTSKLALLHTRNYLPMIKEVTGEISGLLRRSVEQKNAAVRKAIENMRIIASIESMITSVNTELENLEIPAEGLHAFELVALVSRLPYVYGSLLVEAVRRNEWSEKMKRDSSTLAEEMAGYQEEEEKRRKRWVKSIGDIINVDALQGKVLSFEISVKGEERRWPEVSRKEIQDYIRMLRDFKDMDATIESLNTAFKDLDKPTKQQIKKAKNFKNGSVHEATFGKGSGLILRGEEELRALRESNIKLEDELKGSRSRIRKLEDLVHRQSQSRLSIASGFQPGITSPDPPFTPEPPMATSPRLHDDLSRRSSISSRRFSANQPQEHLALNRKILELEAELASERELRASLEKDVAARNIADGDLQRQIVEANSMKKDLMENMEAQQKEFADERIALEEEITRHKIRIEEFEDELDRILGSRDNERTGNDTKMRVLVEELDAARKDAAEDMQKARDEIEALKAVIEQRNQTDADQRVSLIAAFGHLSGGEGTVPADMAILIPGLEELAQRSIDHVKDLERALAMVRTENDTLRSKFESRETELTSKVDAQEEELRRVNEELEAAQTKAASLASELDDERDHLIDLRAKFAEGETGAEALRKRVAEEEDKVVRLSSQLAEAKSHANSLDVELLSQQKKHERLKASNEANASRLKERSLRAKELTQRLYAQKERLLRLLETLGYAISHPDGQMVVTRISKTGNSTVLPGSAVERSTGNISSPTKRVASPAPLGEDCLDLSFLEWSESTSPADEAAKYDALLATLSRLNLDTFVEAIIKRVKDYEHTARKWQKEARMYRDRSHKYQTEAHEKIAFRSFKEGDLALFLPTRNQATRPWAAFNVGAPHYFLREQESFRLRGREWLVARITKVEERVVDLSKAIHGKPAAAPTSPSSASAAATAGADPHSLGAASADDDNPFELSDGLRWYLLDAAEERPGAPATPGLGKTTVASTHVDARGSVRVVSSLAAAAAGGTGGGAGAGKARDARDRDEPKESQAARTLNRSLESRRSSQGSSRKSFVAAAINPLRGSASNEALLVDDANPRRPSHLRTTSQASVAGGAGGGVAEEAGGASSSSALKSPPRPATGHDGVHNNNDETSSPSPQHHGILAAASPSKSIRDPMEEAGAAASPSKAQRSRGLWDSLFQLDVRLERGKGK